MRNAESLDHLSQHPQRLRYGQATCRGSLQVDHQLDLLYRLDFQAYEGFAVAQPRQACDLVFAIGRIIPLRLRHTLSNVEQ
jgi:hypothetical protein